MQRPIRTSPASWLVAGLFVFAATSGGVTPASAAPARQHDASHTMAAGAAHALEPTPTPHPDAYHPGAGPRVVTKPARRTTTPRGASPMDWWFHLDAEPGAYLKPGDTTTLTAYSGQDVGPTAYYIEIFDATTGTFLQACGVGYSCAVAVTQTTSTVHHYTAFISLYGTSFAPPDVQASWTVFVTWAALQVWAGRDFPPGGPNVSIIATSSLDVNPTPYWIVVLRTPYQSNQETVVGYNQYSGTQVGITSAFPSPSCFAAVIARMDWSTGYPTDIQEQSDWTCV